MDRPTCVIIVQNATDAAALSWNVARELSRQHNVVGILCRGGPAAKVLDYFAYFITLSETVPWGAPQSDALARAVVQRYAPAYVVANLDQAGAETGNLVLAFERAGVSAVVLVNEAARVSQSQAGLHALFEAASKLVFPAQEVVDAIAREHRILDGRTFSLLSPEGRSPSDAAAIVRYADDLSTLGQEAATARARAQRDAMFLSDDSAFNADLYLGPRAAAMSRAEAVAHYLHASNLAAPRGRPETGRLVRRPLEGFHPLAYAASSSTFVESAGEDPLAHYIRSGRPKGVWQHQVIRAGAADLPPSAQRVALHGHFHYPELLEDLITRMRRNRTLPDLVLTTSSAVRAQVLDAVLQRMGVKQATVSVVPNRGRDIAPLLTEFGRQAFASYDVIGHIHGKRSPHVDPNVGDAWRDFAWEHLVGGREAMMDAATAAIAADVSLGLVFPEDPYLNDWNENRGLADSLAARMGCDMPLPAHFDFPVGTMFWARQAALKPLQALRLEWDDFPPEPLPVDGTMVHALERLLPFSAGKAGYRYAATIVEGCVR